MSKHKKINYFEMFWKGLSGIILFGQCWLINGVLMSLSIGLVFGSPWTLIPGGIGAIFFI